MRTKNVEHVALYRGGDIRISNSAQEAEQLRRQGWNEEVPEGVEPVEVPEDFEPETKTSAAALAEKNFRASVETGLQGENITPSNPSGAVVPPAVQRKQQEEQAVAEFQEGKRVHKATSGEGAVMSTRDTTQRVQMPKDADDEALPNDFPARDVLMRNALTTPRMVRDYRDLDTLSGLTPADVRQIRTTLKVRK